MNEAKTREKPTAMISDSTFTAMAKETADSMSLVDNSEGDRDRFEEALKALHAVAALQREQDAKAVERLSTTLGSPTGLISAAGIASAIRATPETPQ